METLRILLVGNGGREHALAWKLSQSPWVEVILVVPGNGGTLSCPKTLNIDYIRADDYPELVLLAQKNSINLVVPGPEAPLLDGIEGYFRAVGIRCYGPSKSAARLEGSKAFSKDFMKRHGIPTAAYQNFSDYGHARKYLDEINHNVVIKASGPAAGKGVIIPASKEEARDALDLIMLNKEFGSSGDEVVIEEFLEGEELSILSFCDGYSIRSLPPAQDHKRIYDGDRGPNTGGMGCYAPTKIATRALMDEIERTILRPTIDAMRKDRFPFIGTLFTGLMITKNGPKVLEYNVRFGDPETQTLLPLLSHDTDLAEIMLACTEHWLDGVHITIDPKFSVTVVIAAGGYPGAYRKGSPITLTTPPSDITLFHAGTLIKDGQLQTSGGRVIATSSSADTLEEAVRKAYSGVELINFDGMYYRSDIACRAFKPTVPTRAALTYASAGVNIDVGNEFVERIRKAVSSTRRPGADAEIGGFGGEVDLDVAGYTGAPIIVGAIDGVGTKLKIAQAMKKHDTVGTDLVAMNVNDLVVQGAEPVMFLDYYGCSTLNPETAAQFVEGVAAGCIEANCALVGGETAEMPGMYRQDDYDVAGAAVGTMFRQFRLPLKGDMIEGDVLVGIASSGVHSNGFSLVRKILEMEKVSYEESAPWDESMTVGMSLLAPTKIYVQPLLRIIKKRLVKGLSHITGGGLIENIPRMLPNHLAGEVDVTSWTLPPVFKWLKDVGNVNPVEMGRTFNTGIGMVAVVSKENLRQVMEDLDAAGEKAYNIGRLVLRTTAACILKNLQSWD
jgi:phosphoribosylamine--glycine ligase / phosphoribosylformylglycinamidine cyclo-ligase